ncbi:MAG: SsrA-binding protein [Candidatus Westeberhardia cardiocondylae]|nr:SsrA-binding protein [Candidatus Westeberhardia cardiocondylae]
MFNEEIKILKNQDFRIIIRNKSIYREFSISKEIEAGILLKGWEIKSLRLGSVSINNSYVFFRENEVFLLGANFSPERSSSLYFFCDSVRQRKLLLNKYEISYLIGCVSRKRCKIVVISMYWKRFLVKVKLGITKDKKKYDKRFSKIEFDWKKSRAYIMKQNKRF